MDEKIYVHSTYNTEHAYFSSLQSSVNNKLPQSNKNSFFGIVESFLFSLAGLFIAYVLYRIIQWIYTNLKSTDNTVYNREHCPICLNEFTAPVRADCGHAFCSECLLNHFRTNPINSNCPLCRNFIRDFECLNLKEYVFEDKDQAHASQLQEALRNVMPNQMNGILIFLNEQFKLILLVFTYVLFVLCLCWAVVIKFKLCLIVPHIF